MPLYTSPEEITVFGWSAYKIQIGNVVLDSVINLDCRRTNNKTIGDCSITCVDDYGDIYDSLEYLDEIEIYIQDPDNFYVPNKVWGGWLETRTYQQGNEHLISITGKEYSNALYDKMYTHNYSSLTDIGQICKDIVDDSGLLQSTLISTTLGKSVTLDFDRETHWDALQKTVQPVGYEFGSTLNQEVYVRALLDAPISADDIVLGTNAIVVGQDAIGANVTTEVTVQGVNTATSSTISDSDYELMYGRKRQLFQVNPEANDTNTTLDQATTILNAQKEQIKRYRVDTTFLPYTEPNDLISVSIT